ncbi:dTDP-4-dehydrorhamnose reductase [Neptunicella sp. SCSIO 80796]|uniref:dTDP-4-dehydrorhamnose reductase n=1 Tax=Neptunicella plasticusilytica TaxID=3117012 RepID=UPI003A4DCC5C
MIIVIGNNGQLAKALRNIKSDDELIFLGRQDIDITDSQKLQETLNQFSVTAIINASAYTAVDKAESEPEAAYLLNDTAVANLARFCKKQQIHFVHVSTDYVFGGHKGSPYLPDDGYAPQSVYGASKMAGEQAIREIYPEHSCIIRTSWVYSCEGNNFVKTMLKLMNEKPELSVIDDQIGTPTSANGLAKVCLLAARNNIAGIHHFTDAGVASWYDFAVSIQQLAQQKALLCQVIPIKPISTYEYPTPAKRPAYSVLDKKSLMDSFRIQPRHWQKELSLVLDEISQSRPE